MMPAPQTAANMPPPGGGAGWRGRVASLLALGFYALLGVVVLGLLALEWREERARTRGIEPGDTVMAVAAPASRFGVNMSLEAYGDDGSLQRALRQARNLGATTVRQSFSWATLEPAPGDLRWDTWDHVLPIVAAEGFQVIAVLEDSPRWARPAWDAANPHAPPADMADLAHFAGALAERYSHTVVAYQVWHQPNIAPHWGAGEIDPAGYVRMLRLVSEAIRGADPEAIIIAGGLAPNTEPGGRNMSDVQFLREMYRLGAAPYFDVLGAQPFGFATGPYDRRVDPGVLNFSRVILLREEMVRRGQAATPIWGMDGGWAVRPDGGTAESISQGSDTAAVQSSRLEAAVERVQREWPWMGLLCLQRWQAHGPAGDPANAFALLTPAGEPNAMYRALQEALRAPAVAYPGTVADVSQVFRRIDDLSLGEVRFWGTAIDLDVATGVAQGTLTATVAGEPGEVVVRLDGPAGVQRVRAARALPLQGHRLQIRGNAEQLTALRGVHVTRGAPLAGTWVPLGAGVLLAAWCACGAVGALRQLPVVGAWQWLCRRAERAPQAWRWALLAGTLAVGLLGPKALLRLAALAAYGVLALLYPTGSLYLAVCALPLAPLTVDLRVGSFSVTEITLLASVAAHVWSWLVRPWAVVRASLRRAWGALRWPDLAVAGLVLLAFATGLSAEYRKEALREVRVVVAESALLYALVRSRAYALRRGLLLTYLAAGVGVAVVALARYPFPDGVIVAEGVRRARGFYGSPNNLALILERFLPLGLALFLWGRGRRRWLYGVGAGLLGLVVVLTFSRGGLLLGLPAALLVLALLHGRRATWLLFGGLTAGLLAGLALLGVERFAALADLQQGTSFLRVSLWRSAWAMIRDHPWRGVGPDNFLYWYGDYILPGAEVDRWLSHPHNLVLDFWVRLGIGGVGLLIALLAAFGREAWRLCRRLPEGQDRALVVGLLAGMGAAVAHGLADAFFFVPELAMWFMFALGWVVAGSATPADAVAPREVAGGEVASSG